MKRLVCWGAALALTSVSFAQSFNVDIDATGGWGVGVPADAFGAAAQQAGVWNRVTAMEQVYALRALNGSTTGVTLETTGPGSIATSDNSHASGDFAKLMEDGMRVATEEDFILFKFHDLAPGRYLVYAYAGLHEYGECCRTGVEVTLFSQLNVGTYPFALNTFYQGSFHGQTGGTHARVVRDLPENVDLQITVRTNADADGFAQGTITGIQLLKLPPRLYVNAAASPGGDGRSWATAYTTIQAALDKIVDWDGAVDEVWIAGGVYFPSLEDDQYDTFHVPAGLANLYGGFAGNETELSQRQLGAHPTVLSGNIGGPLPSDNSNTILTMFQNIWGDDDAIVDGFTIQGGSGGVNGAQDRGAGLRVGGGNITVRNCRFQLNEAEDGAAVCATDGSATFVNCEFFNNSAVAGGGAYSSTAISPNPGPTARFINCRFHNNDAAIRGGAMSLNGGETTLVNCVFTGNTSYVDGGAIRASGANTTLTVLNCTLAGNAASSLGVGAGGAISLGSGATGTLINSILWDNVAGTNSAGTLASQVTWSGASLSANYTTIQYYAPLLLPGTGNSSANPQFVNATGGDGYGDFNDNVRLLPGSPAIDSGSNLGIGQDWGDLDGDADTGELTPLDLDRDTRRVDDPATADTGFGFGARVDRGAYEFRPPGCALVGDLDDDGDVDLTDLATLLSNFGTVGGASPESGDSDGDGDVDLSDLSGLLGHFGETCP